jgi:hypothetical protein
MRMCTPRNGFQLPQIATPESVNDPQGVPRLTLCEDDAIWNLGLADSLLVTERPVSKNVEFLVATFGRGLSVPRQSDEAFRPVLLVLLRSALLRTFACARCV